MDCVLVTETLSVVAAFASAEYARLVAVQCRSHGKRLYAVHRHQIPALRRAMAELR